MTDYEKPHFTKKDVEILGHQCDYNGFAQIYTYRLRYRHFSGEWGNPIERELYDRGHAVVVLLVDPKLHVVVMIEQFRMGALNDPKGPWLLELVAGIIEKNETAESVAIRETKEESGLEISQLTPICNYWVSPGASSESVNLFYAEVDAKNASGIHGLGSEDEDILVHRIPIERAFHFVKTGRINNAAAIIALQWLELNYKR